MEVKYNNLVHKSVGNENLVIIGELYKEKKKTIGKSRYNHEKSIYLNLKRY